MTTGSPEQARLGLPLIACIAICMLGPLSGISQTAMPPVLPRIGEHFAEVPNAGVLVRLMMTGLSAAMIVGALASGFLAERFGQLRLLYACLMVFALTGVASYFSDNLYFIVAMRIVLGVVNSAAGVLGTALLAMRLDGARRDKWLGFYVTIGTIMSLVWVTLAGRIGAIDWRLIFLLQLLALPAALFIGLTLTPDQPSGSKQSGAAGAGDGIPWGMTLFGLVCGAIGSSGMVYLPFHFNEAGLGDPAKIGTLLAMSGLGGVLTALGFGWIRKFVPAIPVFIGGFLLNGAGLLLALSTNQFALLAFALFVSGAGFGIVTPNLFSACAAATPTALRTRVFGFMRAGFYAGPLVAQLFLEPAMRQGGPSMAVGTIAIGSLAAAGIFALFRSRFDPVAEEPVPSL